MVFPQPVPVTLNTLGISVAVGEYFSWSRDLGWEGGRVQPVWAELTAMPATRPGIR